MEEHHGPPTAVTPPFPIPRKAESRLSVPTPSEFVSGQLYQRRRTAPHRVRNRIQGVQDWIDNEESRPHKHHTLCISYIKYIFHCCQVFAGKNSRNWRLFGGLSGLSPRASVSSEGASRNGSTGGAWLCCGPRALLRLHKKRGLPCGPRGVCGRCYSPGNSQKRFCCSNTGMLGAMGECHGQ